MADVGDAPDDSIFDLSKKKKKKKPRDDQTSAEKEGDENASNEPSTTIKEKKSKSVAFAAESSENQENVNVDQTAAAAAAAGDDDDDGDVLALRKKKKKKATNRDATGATGEGDIQKETTAGTTGDETTSDATSVQGEYTYDDLLSRVFNIIREKNPNVNEGEKIKLTLKPPQVARIGTKRTSFSNFGEICKSLKRQEKHLHQYLLAELGTNGSIDANNALIIKGRFQQKQIESVLRSYIKEYVICKTCRSPDTLLQKEERLSVLLCNNCRSRYFVSGIKTGFQAQVGKRAATRAKAT
jgi:translation initiation factor 2 subunit 2